jgi:hypothetical protein
MVVRSPAFVGRTLRRAAFVACLLVVVLMVPAGAITPIPIVSTKADEFEPGSDGVWLGWSMNSTGHPRHYDAVAMKLAIGNRQRINPQGSEGRFGDVVRRTGVAVYQEYRGSVSNIVFYDLAARERLRAPKRVNSRDWEFDPRASSRYLLFGRDYLGSDVEDLLLYDRDRHVLRRLARVDDDRTTLVPGSAGRRWVTWTICDRTTCRAYLHRAGRGTFKIPSPHGRPVYAPAVDERDGRVYVVRSGFGCGREVRILRLRLHDLRGPAHRLWTFPGGVDLDPRMVVAHNRRTGREDLYVSRWRCGERESDVFVLRGADAA